MLVFLVVFLSNPTATAESLERRCLKTLAAHQDTLVEKSHMTSAGPVVAIRAALSPEAADFCEEVKTEPEQKCVEQNAGARASLAALKAQCISADARCMALTPTQRAATEGCRGYRTTPYESADGASAK